MAHPPVTHWISEYGFVGWCAACGAAKHERERPVGEVQCDDCRADYTSRAIPALHFALCF